MASTNRPALLNRVLLALIGLALAVAGIGGAAFGTGIIGELPGLDRTVPLIPGGLQLPGWTVPAALTAALVVGLACLAWLIAQTHRRPRTGTWGLPAPGPTPDADVSDTTGRAGPPGHVRIDARDVAAAVSADITGYPGVATVTTDLTGPHSHPTVHLQVSTAPDASTAGIRARVHDHALPRLRAALEPDTLRVRLTLHPGRGTAPRPR